jgi:WD40 repeat protein
MAIFMSGKMQREPLIATAADVFVKYPYLFVPFLDRVSLNRLFSINREIHAEASRAVTLPWPEKLFHAGSTVMSVAFSQQGGLLAYGCHNGRIQIRNRSNGQRNELEGHANAVHSVSFSPDGKLLASGSYDCTIRLWKLAGSSCRVFRGHTDSVSSVTFSPGGSTLATGSFDGSVRLWNVSEGRCTRTLRDSRMDKVYSIAWSPSGVTIAVANRGGLIFLWDISNEQNTMSVPVVIQGHENLVTTIAYSSDGRYLASGSYDKTVKLWHAADLSCAKVLMGHTELVRSVCFSPNCKIIASGSSDRSVRLWNVEAAAAAAAENGSCLRNLSGHHAAFILSVSFSPDGRTLASGGFDRMVRLCDISSL